MLLYNEPETQVSIPRAYDLMLSPPLSSPLTRSHSPQGFRGWKLVLPFSLGSWIPAVSLLEDPKALLVLMLCPEARALL